MGKCSQSTGAEQGTDLEGQLDRFYNLEPLLVNRPGGTAQYTPFHMVALHYAFIVGQFLHEKGADINAFDRHGRTPLDLLFEHGKPNQTFNFVVGENHRERFICDYALGGPIYWAREGQHFGKMVPVFRAWGAKTRKELFN